MSHKKMTTPAKDRAKSFVGAQRAAQKQFKTIVKIRKRGEKTA